MTDNNNVNAGNKALLSNSAYDKLSLVGTKLFPLLLAFYGTLSQIWSWPKEVQIMATLGAVQVLLTGLVALAQVRYHNSEEKYDGSVVLTADGAIAKLEPNTGFVDPAAKDAVFKVTTLEDPGLG